MMPVDSLHTRETCGHTNPPCCASSAQYSHHDDDDDGVREVVHGEENATHPLEGPTTAPHHNDANDTTNGNDTTNDNDNNSSTSPCSSSSIPIHTTNNNTPAAGDASLHTTATAPPAASDHVLIQTLEEENKRLQAQVTRLQQLVESAALHEQQSEARQQAEQHKQVQWTVVCWWCCGIGHMLYCCLIYNYPYIYHVLLLSIPPYTPTQHPHTPQTQHTGGEQCIPPAAIHTSHPALRSSTRPQY